MAIEFIWQLPGARDSRYADARLYKRAERLPDDAYPYGPQVTDPRGNSFNYFDYLLQIARAADLTGFDGIQIPHDPNGDDSWIVAGYLARNTRHLQLITEFEASRGSSVYAAKNAVSYQRFSNQRFAWQLTPGGSTDERRQLGDFVADDQLLPRIDEFLTVAKGVITQSPFSFKGSFFEVLNGGFQGPLGNNSVPKIYLNGSSAAAYELSARQADVHVLDAAPIAQVKEAIEQLQSLAKVQGRSLTIGLRIDLLVRETEAEALNDAQRFWQQAKLGEAQLLEPGLWSLPAAYTGATATLVGSYEQVHARLLDYVNAGVSNFIFGASPHLEEAYRVGEHLLPALRKSFSESTQSVVAA
ncbi:LLM class flavin-dependent oxidoreductase [Cellvibrio sp. NN19]|uniref:LLM class flavin-dependent oxidoreductase n=1 Tax=Cellvibrio chitinivorans TaxID=3102792 RepID=UPI002B405579|nr:LLM class flavin-dependent oxidoreductase [Cellvibrio sp. NN19]